DTNPDQPYLTVQFYDANSSAIGSPFALDRALTNYWVRNADPLDLTPASAGSHQWGKYVRTSLIPAHARTATVGIGSSPNTLVLGAPDTYVDLVKLDVVPCTNAITRGLVTHLEFDGDYSDASGNGVVGQPINGPTFEAGQLGQGVRITTTKDGTVNKYVSLGYPDVLKFGSDATGDATDFSFSFWAKIYEQADDQAF